jgi:phage terminase large subunit-like protein
LVDELARTKTEEAYGLLRDGLGPRNGRLVAISTAGDDETTPLGRLRAAAHATDGFAREGAYKHVRRGGFSWHEWSLDPGDDMNDLGLLKAANPASWVDEAELRARRDSPSVQPWQLARFTAGLWVKGEQSAIAGEEWAACRDPVAEIPDDARGVVVGGDLATRGDTTAFIAAWLPGTPGPLSPILGFLGGPWFCRLAECDKHVDAPGRLCEEHKDYIPVEPGPIVLSRPIVLAPPGDGRSVQVDDMVDACAQFAGRWPSCTFAFDPLAGGEHLLQRLERELPDSHEFVEFPQRTGRLCGASMRFAELVAAGQLRHPGDETLTRHVLAASAKFVGEHWRFGRPSGARQPIDALTAAMIAVDTVASRPSPPRSVYEDRFVT